MRPSGDVDPDEVSAVESNDDEGINAGREETLDFKSVVKLFRPWCGATWLLTEFDPDDRDIAFGLCDLGMGIFPISAQVRGNCLFHIGSWRAGFHSNVRKTPQCLSRGCARLECRNKADNPELSGLRSCNGLSGERRLLDAKRSFVELSITSDPRTINAGAKWIFAKTPTSEKQYQTFWQRAAQLSANKL
jgi:hypothetical protein